MLAYQNDKKLKTDLIKEMKAHRKADHIIKGTYGKMNGAFKGCAVGCAINSLNVATKKDWPTDSHVIYESELGIPRALAYLEDTIFENLPDGKAQDFAVDFLEAISVGSDLRLVVPKFMVWLLADDTASMPDLPSGKEFETLKSSIDVVGTLYQRIVDGGTVADDEWKNAENMIEASRLDARDARAARAARDAWDARAARDARDARAAWDARVEKSAEKILCLIKEAK